MEQTPDQISRMVAAAKSEFERRCDRLLYLFSFVPDDKLTWSPSSTARSSLRIVAHCALTSRFFANVIKGTLPYETMPSVEEFFSRQGEVEKKVATREEALALFEETKAELCDAIDTVNAENIQSTANSPFGALPLQFWIYQGESQMAGHAGQLEYLQTVWGDMDYYLG